MRKSTRIIAGALAGALLAGCTTDPYTGEQKVSNTAGGAGSARWPGPASGCWPAATTAAMR